MAPAPENRAMLASLFDALDDDATPIRRKLELLTLARKQGTGPSTAADRILLERLAAYKATVEELREALQGIEGVVQKLTGSPQHAAVFLGFEPVPDGERARVSHAAGEHLVQLAEGIDRGALAVGDRVYLAAERNVILARADTATPRPGACATVDRWTPDNRVVVSDRDTETVLVPAAGLDPGNLAPGDVVRVDRQAGLAIERIAAPDESRQFIFQPRIGSWTGCRVREDRCLARRDDE